MRTQLESCTTPDDQDVVKGLVAFLLSGLPEDFTEEKHEDVLRANGLYRVRVLRKLTEAKLEALGMSMGDAMMLLEALQEEKAAPAEALAVVAAAPRDRRPEMRANAIPGAGAVGTVQDGAQAACAARDDSSGPGSADSGGGRWRRSGWLGAWVR